MIVLIDNYDSFSYNLYQMIGSIRPDIRVIRNDAVTIEQLRSLHPQALILSPGPGRPKDAGICMDAVSAFRTQLPILGVCLGHQAICQAYGAVVSYAGRLMHGKQSPAILDHSCPLFTSLADTVPVARYHSLATVPDTIPDTLRVTARTPEGEIMAVQDVSYSVFGVQFHPESILTPDGETMLKQFLALADV